MRIVGIVGSPNAQGATASLVDAVVARAASAGPCETDTIVLSEFDLGFADGTRAEAQSGDTRAVLARIEAGDAFVLGTPIYRASYSGALKNLLDLVSRGSWDGLARPFEAKAVGVVATGASAHHFLGLEPLIALLVNFFSAYVVPPGLYATSDQVDATGDVRDPDIARRTEDLADELLALTQAIGRHESLRRPTPQI
jgi:FMN reductase